VPASLEPTLEQRILEAASVLPPGGAVTGWAALAWLGASWFDGLSSSGRDQLPVTLASCARDIRTQAGFELSQERLDPSEIIVHDGLEVVIPARAVFFEMRYAATQVDAMVAMDMAAFSDLVSLQEEWDYISAHPGWTGVPQAREALPSCDENSWSPWEVRLRDQWTRAAGMPRPRCNLPVFNLNGQLVGTPDLIDVEHGVIGQYEGAVHLVGRQRGVDVQTEHAYRQIGLEPLPVVVNDFRNRGLLVRRIHETYARAASRPGSRQLWTVTPPPWWTPTETVEQRRALTGHLRDVVLERRRRIAS
jgi:hypothetical protein